MSLESEFEKFEEFEKCEEEGGFRHELNQYGNRTGRKHPKANFGITGVATTNPAQPPIVTPPTPTPVPFTPTPGQPVPPDTQPVGTGTVAVTPVPGQPAPTLYTRTADNTTS